MGGRETFYLLVHSLDGRSGQYWTRTKPGASTPSGSPTLIEEVQAPKLSSVVFQHVLSGSRREAKQLKFNLAL